jgi:hypothetical protein
MPVIRLRLQHGVATALRLPFQHRAPSHEPQFREAKKDEPKDWLGILSRRQPGVGAELVSRSPKSVFQRFLPVVSL